MKKLLLVGLIALSSTTFAAETAPQTSTANNPFAKAEQLYKDKNYNAAYQEMDRLAKTGNAQAIYNQGFMSELGQGTAQDSKKRLLLIRKPPIKVIQSRHIALLKFIWRVS